MQSELTRETRWLRVYKNGPGLLHYESKFLTDKIEISYEEIASDWEALSTEEQSEFALAFIAKPTLTADDNKIAELLASSENADVRANICSLIPRLQAPQRFRTFLVANVQGATTGRSNYFQTIAQLKDPFFLTVVQGAFDQYLQQKQDRESCLVDFAACCRALAVLDQNMFSTCQQQLRSLSNHKNASVRAAAAHMLRQLRE